MASSDLYTQLSSLPNSSYRKLEHSDSLPFKKRRYTIDSDIGESVSLTVSTIGEASHSPPECSTSSAVSQTARSMENILTTISQKVCLFYTDRSEENDPDPLTPLTPFGSTPNFPAKMYAMLANPMLKDIAEWLPHGRSWRVINQKEFEKSILPIFFDHSKFSSFVRQANGWGFRRIHTGPDKNSYYHEYFLRGLPHLCKKLTRPGRSKKTPMDPSETPNFYTISELHPLPVNMVPDEAVLLLSTIRDGPKAKVPVLFNYNACKGGDADLATSSPAAQPVPITREILDKLLPMNKSTPHASLSTNLRPVNMPPMVGNRMPTNHPYGMFHNFNPRQPSPLDCFINSLSHFASPETGNPFFSNL